LLKTRGRDPRYREGEDLRNCVQQPSNNVQFLACCGAAIAAWRPNSPLKLARPGFGPAAEPPHEVKPERRRAACIARLTCMHAVRRAAVTTRALAAQLNV